MLRVEGTCYMYKCYMPTWIHENLQEELWSCCRSETSRISSKNVYLCVASTYLMEGGSTPSSVDYGLSCNRKRP
jgi:hypothetical protein